jgi:CBS-domain-containing membrane protein
MDFYSPLTLIGPKKSISLMRSPDQNSPLLGLDTPALEVMTDFTRTPAISILANTQIDNALNQMIYSSVRLFFVVNRDFTILGSVTSYDIEGEKPVLFLQSRDYRIDTCAREDITVQDIMTAVQNWRVLNYNALSFATLGDIVETFRGFGQRHLIVVEESRDRGGAQVVRGLFSVTALERVLDIHIDTAEPAKSFADIQHALG